MMSFDPVSLSWLLPPPDDFRERVKTLAGSATVSGMELRRLAEHALDINQSTSLARAIAKQRTRIETGGGLDIVRIAYLGNGTTDFVQAVIVAGALRHGVLADVYTPAFGQALAETLDPGSALATHRADVALIALDHRGHGLTLPTVDAAAGREAVRRAEAQLTLMIDRLAETGAQIILQTAPQPYEPWAGHADAGLGGSVRAQVAALNERIRQLAVERSCIVFDAEALAAQVGTARWFNPRLWNQAKVPFDLEIAPLYGDHIGRLLGALRGKTRKALVLDLDNTLWGGVIGDDGLDGIKIGQGSADGEAHLAVQRLALDLKNRGIILAVCSKNEEATARSPFRELDEMLIREDDIAVFVANWTDKGSNIRFIAQTLNIGTDALVFLDDNPAERARVRQVLPEVAIPELPDDPSLYAATLASAGYFETIGLSENDVQRGEQYRANAMRTQAMESIGDMDAYYASLDMVCDIRPFDAPGRTRIAQLINKTNQFNLTTRRYSPVEVQAMESAPDIFALQVRLTDRFGDNGMISVAIFRKADAEWICDTWLMSCRVLGRRVEEAVLNTVAAAAAQAGVERLIGVYRPTPRNAMVADFWEKLGFARTTPPDGLIEAGTGEEVEAWVLRVADYRLAEVPMVCQIDRTIAAGEAA